MDPIWRRQLYEIMCRYQIGRAMRQAATLTTFISQRSWEDIGTHSGTFLLLGLTSDYVEDFMLCMLQIINGSEDATLINLYTKTFI